MIPSAAHRDRAWLEGRFADHHRHVLAYAARRVRVEEVDDVLSEVFAAAWKHRDRVPDPPLPWLYRNASHHVLHDHLAYVLGCKRGAAKVRLHRARRRFEQTLAPALPDPVLCSREATS